MEKFTPILSKRAIEMETKIDKRIEDLCITCHVQILALKLGCKNVCFSSAIYDMWMTLSQSLYSLPTPPVNFPKGGNYKNGIAAVSEKGKEIFISPSFI